MAAQNDRGGGGGATLTVRVVEGWSSRNDGFNFWQNPPDGCGVICVGVSGSGGQADSFHCGRELRRAREKNASVPFST